METQYEVTFFLVNGEIGHVMEAASVLDARNSIKHEFEVEEGPLLSLTDDLVIVKDNIQYFIVKEYEAA